MSARRDAIAQVLARVAERPDDWSVRNGALHALLTLMPEPRKHPDHEGETLDLSGHQQWLLADALGRMIKSTGLIEDVPLSGPELLAHAVTVTEHMERLLWEYTHQSVSGARDRLLYGEVWCLTCCHDHIPGIPLITYRCTGADPETDGCGFGVWDSGIAQRHAEEYEDAGHIVYAEHHITIPMHMRESLWEMLPGLGR